MFLFIKQTISEAFRIFSVYFLIMYSLGLTFSYIISALKEMRPTLLLLLLISALILYLRKVFQKRFRKIYRRFAIDSASGLLVRLVLSFSLSFHLFVIFNPKFRLDFIEAFSGFEADMAILLAKYLLSAVVGVVTVAIVLFILRRGSGWGEKKTKPGLGIVLSIIGMFIISAIGSRYSGISGSWYGISEAFLEKIGYFSFGSIPVFQFRLLFFGSDLKKK